MEMDKILIENLVSEYGLPIHKVALDNICKDLNGSGQNSAELKECCMCKRTRQCYKSTADQWYCQECINSLPCGEHNNERDVICSTNPCDYCLGGKLCSTCDGFVCNCFAGRKLTPVL